MVVNDSRMIREYLCNVIRSHNGFDLCETARDGEDALRKLDQADPDLILLDLEMPNLDGVTFIDKVMTRDRPIPIIVVSSYGDSGDDKNNNIIFECLDSGAVDFISLPSDSGITDRKKTSQDLIARIQAVSSAYPDALVPLKERKKESPVTCAPLYHSGNRKMIVIGSSTGGPRVVTDIFSKLPANLPASILIVQHMPPSFTSAFARHIGSASRIDVREAKEGDLLEQGSAYVAPGDYHTTVTQSGTIHLDKSPKRQGVRPSVNISMVSASDVFGPNTLGVLLSGMGQDGAFGMKMIKRRGGRTIAQDSTTSVVFGMPKAAYDLGAVDEMVPANRMAEAIVRILGEMESERKREGMQQYVR
ncbi:chemotaxis response regulator methylesterase CheB [Candidatus Nitrososphaera gargensis Ga9.2]|uniref:Protein-glutamate methylesterase/protein-glutamine glutaminase n=2 Tax=Candidatus Nitrososphaera gargensis TaxID=497727 RepID=K0I9E3_NITGG|nr:chemotaxis response regulator methylesterase CheB [Candidatus Nitrososphaera gargensis Ga9.2]